MNLIEGLQEEMSRCREFLLEYEAIPQGIFGATIIKQEIKKAEQTIATGDTIGMMMSYESLKGCS
jgi:hypothetical protein